MTAPRSKRTLMSLAIQFCEGWDYVCLQSFVISLYRKFLQNGTVTYSTHQAYRHHSVNVAISFRLVFWAITGRECL